MKHVGKHKRRKRDGEGKEEELQEREEGIGKVNTGWEVRANTERMGVRRRMDMEEGERGRWSGSGELRTGVPLREDGQGVAKCWMSSLQPVFVK